jgi:hypothetical protein
MEIAEENQQHDFCDLFFFDALGYSRLHSIEWW